MAEQGYAVSELKVGARLEVLSENHTPLLSCVISKTEDECVWVSHAKGESMPSIIYNSRVILKKIITKDDSILMLYGTILGSNAQIWKIGELSEFSIFNRRENYRQSTDISTTVCYLPQKSEEAEGVDHANTMNQAEKCKVLNISRGGLLFNSKKLFPVNSNVQMGEFCLYPNHPPFTLRCRILHTREWGGKHIHGCCFIELTAKEQERIVQDIFLLQRDEIRRRNR